MLPPPRSATACSPAAGLAVSAHTVQCTYRRTVQCMDRTGTRDAGRGTRNQQQGRRGTRNGGRGRGSSSGWLHTGARLVDQVGRSGETKRHSSRATGGETEKETPSQAACAMLADYRRRIVGYTAWSISMGDSPGTRVSVSHVIVSLPGGQNPRMSSLLANQNRAIRFSGTTSSPPQFGKATGACRGKVGREDSEKLQARERQPIQAI